MKLKLLAGPIFSLCVIVLTPSAGSAQVSPSPWVPPAAGMAFGAAAGAAIGHNSGELRHSTTRGAAIGATVGAITGALVGRHNRQSVQRTRVSTAQFFALGAQAAPAAGEEPNPYAWTPSSPPIVRGWVPAPGAIVDGAGDGLGSARASARAELAAAAAALEAANARYEEASRRFHEVFPAGCARELSTPQHGRNHPAFCYLSSDVNNH